MKAFKTTVTDIHKWRPFEEARTITCTNIVVTLYNQLSIDDTLTM